MAKEKGKEKKDKKRAKTSRNTNLGRRKKEAVEQTGRLDQTNETHKSLPSSDRAGLPVLSLSSDTRVMSEREKHEKPSRPERKRVRTRNTTPTPSMCCRAHVSGSCVDKPLASKGIFPRHIPKLEAGVIPRAKGGYCVGGGRGAARLFSRVIGADAGYWGQPWKPRQRGMRRRFSQT